MPQYEFHGPTGWRYADEQFASGDTVEVSEAFAESFPQFFEGVGDDAEVEPENPATDDAVAAPVDPDDYTVSEFEDHLEESTYSDAELDALAEAEGPEDDGGRAGIHDAIESARGRVE